MFDSSYKITRIWGIPIKVHISLAVLIILMVFRLGPIYGPLTALGLLVSIVLHELGHSLVAIRKGCHVREITLMLMGGVAQMDRIPTRPLDEFLMALAGPVVSMIIGISGLVAGIHLPLEPMFYAGDWPINIVQFLGIMNLSLALFNLLPAFPMDGGRILRAALTPKFGRLRATFYASRLGKIMAVVMGFRGIYPPTDPIMIFIAIMIYILAGQEYRIVQMQEAARNYAFGGMWSPFQTSWDSNYREESEDRVIISPPPYKTGPDSESNLRPFTRKNPFSDLFGQ